MNLIEALKALEQSKKVKKKNENGYWFYKGGMFIKHDTIFGRMCDMPESIELKNFDDIYNEDLWEEVKKPVLDYDERTYLLNLIAPFKKRIRHIMKASECDGKCSHLIIVLENEQIKLPKFKTKDMYKGMEIDKAYTLNELNLL